MSGLEVFGAIGTAIGLIQVARSSLGRARRVGKTIGDLEVILDELMELRDEIDPVADATQLALIYRLVQEVTELVEKNRDTGLRAMKFLWTNSLDQDVQRININLQGVCRRIQNRAWSRHRTAIEEGLYSRSTHTGLEPTYGSGTSSPPAPESIPPRASSHGSVERPPGFQGRRESMNAVTLRATLVLRDANYNLVRDPIHLEKLSILERNYTSRFRAIQYETADTRTTVTHEIRFGTIPSTPDELDAKEVSFLEDHLVTVETTTEAETETEKNTVFSLYLLDPLYKFHSSTACNDFMARVRERTLLATFLPKQISKTSRSDSKGCLSLFASSSELKLARWKVVRMWERERVGQNSTPLVTITFHDRSKHPPKFTERSLQDFRDNPFQPRNGLVVELVRYDLDEHIVFKFDTKDQASNFVTAFERRRRRGSALSGLNNPTHRIHRKPIGTH